MRTPHKLTIQESMEMSFFALPSKQGPVQGRFKPAHLLISLSTRVPACVRRFETATALNYGRTESKKDISMLTRRFLHVLASDEGPVLGAKEFSWPRNPEYLIGENHSAMIKMFR